LGGLLLLLEPESLRELQSQRISVRPFVVVVFSVDANVPRFVVAGGDVISDKGTSIGFLAGLFRAAVIMNESKLKKKEKEKK